MNKFLIASLAFGSLAVQASAVSLQYDFNRVVTGDVPSGSGPFATALFEDIAANKVRLTFTHNLGSHPDQKISSAYFTVDPTIASITSTTISDSSGKYNSFGYGQNSFNAPLGAKFDLKLGFAPSNPGFNPGSVLILELQGTGLNAMSFDFLTNANSIGATPAMIHLQGIPNGGSTHLDPVPEPATLALLSTAAVALLRKKKATV